MVNRHKSKDFTLFVANMSMTDNSYWFSLDTEEESLSYERYSTNTDSSSEWYLQNEDLSPTEYTSYIDIASVPEVGDDKYIIFNFYKTLSTKLLKTFSVCYLAVIVSVEYLIKNYRAVSDGNLPKQIDYTRKSHCIGYLHRYAACHSALVFDAVLEIFDSSSSDILSSKLNKHSLNVMFLGGGPGNDFVGFLTALYGHHQHLFDMDVTVVDNMLGWEDMFYETIESLRKGDGGKAGSIFEEVDITTTFISADLKDSKEWDEIMQTKLKNADIVFFVKVLSHMPDGDKLQVLQNVVTSMKLESYLIYIDYPYPHRVFASLRNHLRTVYQGWEMRYYLGHKDFAFGCSNITSCGATVKVFERYEDDYFSYYF